MTTLAEQESHETQNEHPSVQAEASNSVVKTY